MTTRLRVALFTDSFSEANGVATVSREFAAFAQRREYPFFCVCGGVETKVSQRQTVTTMELKRGITSFPLDYDLYFDPLLSRFRNKVVSEIRPFQPDLVHITGPGDMGILGLWVAHILQVPLVASWHTNLHEYAGLRIQKAFRFLPAALRDRFASLAERQSLRACMWFYYYGRFTFGPNETAVNLLAGGTGRPSFLMSHGVDTYTYCPSRRNEPTGTFCIGYVGRLTPEKNVRLLAKLEAGLLAAGRQNFRILMVGDGSEKEWLRRKLKFGVFPGILRGDVLANAFAEMDVFVFPSETDTFGLVLLEAMASGVPLIVNPATGARIKMQDCETGFYANDVDDFVSSVLRLMDDRALQQRMSSSAREFACSRRWDGVFDDLYTSYESGLETIGSVRRSIEPVVPG